MLLLHSTYSCECSTKRNLPFSETQYEIGKTFIFPRNCIEDPSFILFLIIMMIGILFLLVWQIGTVKPYSNEWKIYIFRLKLRMENF